jgi:hypothetical protein
VPAIFTVNGADAVCHVSHITLFTESGGAVFIKGLFFAVTNIPSDIDQILSAWSDTEDEMGRGGHVAVM